MLFFGGLTYLYCLWRCKAIRDAARQRDVINTCLACQTVLVIIAERWKLATSYRDLFEMLSERTISMMCGDLSDGNDVVAEVGGVEGDNAKEEQPGMPDWTAEFDGLDLPLESEWLVSELMQGVHQDSYSAGSFDFVDADFDTQLDTFNLVEDWNVGMGSNPSYRGF